MDEMQENTPRPVNPRRRKKTKAEVFKETYLPAIIAGVALLFILIAIIGSAVQSSQRKKQNAQLQQSAAAEEQKQKQQWDAECSALLKQAADYANAYDYAQAITTLRSFSGSYAEYTQLSDAIKKYTDIQSSMVTWDDPSKVLNLSFQLLIADPVRAFNDDEYGRSYNRNFITTEEFRIILDQLYDNGYVLVDLDDIVQPVQTEEGTVYQANTLQLPADKKPLILTQTHVNYNIFMTDGNGDKLPDKDGAGFASKLIVNADGDLVNEIVDKDGNLLTGEYDLVPILNSFIKDHPDFSYKGAKAIIAVTGYDGLFGYRTNPGAKSWLGADAYNQEIENAKKIAQALRDDGYRIACYTYSNTGYGEISFAQMQNDLNSWKQEVTPILGTVDILAFAQISDISGTTPYSGNKFNSLMDAGFRYYLGFCDNGTLWADVQPDHFRQARILVTGSNLKYHSDWFTGILEPISILSSLRGNIPQ